MRAPRIACCTAEVIDRAIEESSKPSYSVGAALPVADPDPAAVGAAVVVKRDPPFEQPRTQPVLQKKEQREDALVAVQHPLDLRGHPSLGRQPELPAQVGLHRSSRAGRYKRLSLAIQSLTWEVRDHPINAPLGPLATNHFLTNGHVDWLSGRNAFSPGITSSTL